MGFLRLSEPDQVFTVYYDKRDVAGEKFDSLLKRLDTDCVLFEVELRLPQADVVSDDLLVICRKLGKYPVRIAVPARSLIRDGPTVFFDVSLILDVSPFKIGDCRSGCVVPGNDEPHPGYAVVCRI